MEFVRDLLNAVPTSANVRHYANIVSEKAVLRRLIKLTEEIENDCYLNKEPVEVIMEETEKKMFQLLGQRNSGDFMPIRQVVINTLENIERASKTKGNVTGIPTGFTDLDYKTSGLQNSDFILIAARPSMGKTAFVLNIAQYMAFKKDKAVAIFSLEMSREQLMNRLLSMESKVDSQHLRTGNLKDDEWSKLIESAGMIGESRLMIDAALDDVSFEVEEGDFVGIIGATGSGKSTLITHMNGLNKPTSGKIYIDGRDLWADPEKIRDFRFLTGLVFQYPEYQLFEETCYKDIAFGPKNMGLDEAEVDRRVHEAADFVGLDPALLERSPFELSGGQKRRVAVAGVMAMKPRILVLDEPAAGLDPEGRDDILSEVKEYHKKTGTTVLLVSHSMEDIAKYANRVLVMSNKKIAMYDTVEKIFARAPELLELGLSVPQVTKIFLKLREMGVDVPADVYTIPYAVKTLLEAKRRRDAGESLVLPRSAAQKGGAV